MPSSLAAMLLLTGLQTSATDADTPRAAPSPVPAAPAGTELVRVAVLPLRVEGLKLNEVQRLDVLVRARVEMRGGVQVQAESTTNQLVDSAQALGLDCELRDVQCAARLGRLADVAVVIVGEAAALGDEVGLEMRLVDVEAAEVRREVRALLPADPDAQLEPLNAFFTSLFDEEAPLSTLAVTAEPSDVSLTIDGLAVGSLPPDRKIGGLLPGEHVVVAQKDGYLPTSTRLELDARAPTEHTLKLEVDPSLRPIPPTALEIALPLGAAALSIAATGAGVAAGLYGLGPWLAFQQTQGALFERSPAQSSYPTDAQGLHGELDAHAKEWNDNGRVWAAAGGLTALVASAAALAATTWSVAVLSRAADAAALE